MVSAARPCHQNTVFIHSMRVQCSALNVAFGSLLVENVLLINLRRLLTNRRECTIITTHFQVVKSGEHPALKNEKLRRHLESTGRYRHCTIYAALIWLPWEGDSYVCLHHEGTNLTGELLGFDSCGRAAAEHCTLSVCRQHNMQHLEMVPYLTCLCRNLGLKAPDDTLYCLSGWLVTLMATRTLVDPI